jgi:hypothetical protein
VKQVFLAVLTIVLSSSAVAQAKPFAGWLLDPSRSGGASIEVWPDPANPRKFTWRLVAPDRALVAEMPQPDVPRGLTVNFGQCKVSGVLRQDVLAFVKHRKRQEWSHDVRRVWVADLDAKAFVPHDPKGVACRNEGYGV